MPCHSDVYVDVLSPTHGNLLAMMLELLPTIMCKILIGVVDRLDVEVGDRRSNVGETPGNASIVAHNDERHPRQAHARHVEIAAGKVNFIPCVGYLMWQMH